MYGSIQLYGTGRSVQVQLYPSWSAGAAEGASEPSSWPPSALQHDLHTPLPTSSTLAAAVGVGDPAAGTSVSVRAPAKRNRPRIFTVGHSNHDEDKFHGLLAMHDITHLVDVRRIPASRFTQFTKRQLEQNCARQGVRYTWLGAEVRL